MTDLMNMVSSKAAESGFYPTPAHLIDKMLLGVNMDYVSSILEPSAGKGDLAYAAAYKIFRRKYDGKLSDVDLDCIEIDANLRAILKDKGFRVVHDDFLTYRTMKRYSLIIMNPPFEDGAKHVLKALSLLDDGGRLVALVNAETIRNPYTNERKELVKALSDAKIEYLAGAFLDAERKTDVDVAMISFTKPVSEDGPGIIMENLRKAHRYVEMSDDENRALTKADYIDAIIDRYNYEIECGIRLIKEWRSMSRLLSHKITPDHGYSGSPILEMAIGKDAPRINAFVKEVRKKYWSALFCSPQIIGQLTYELEQMLYKKLDELTEYEFSAYNIYELMLQMNSHVSSSIENTIMKLFDDWTFKYHYDEYSQNRHYFNGWRTNDAFAVNKKVIIPMYLWDSIFNKFDWRSIRRKMEDIEKIMNYLDGGRTAEGRPINDVLLDAEKENVSRKIDSKYFYVTIYKKGTIHIEFKDMNLLAKFNVFAARGKNWLPPSFGKKRYKDLDREEKAVVDSFIGDDAERKYDGIVSHADYFLADGSTMLNLTA